jgi:hypothetical protein
VNDLSDVSARLRDVFAFLQANPHGTEVDLRDVEYAACNGMLHTLDPHSDFMSPDAYKEMNVSTSGAFAGLGIVISLRDQLLAVMKPMPDSPAGRAGLERLDRIVEIDGEPRQLRVTVTNHGKLPVHRLRGTSGSDNPYFDEKELVFGMIAAGQSRTATAPLGFCCVEGRKLGSSAPRDKNSKRTCKIPMDALDRGDELRVSFDAAAGDEPAPVGIRPTVRALERPQFQYGYQIADDRGGNGDGRLQRGEHATMYLTVKNVGKGRSPTPIGEELAARLPRPDRAPLVACAPAAPDGPPERRPARRRVTRRDVPTPIAMRAGYGATHRDTSRRDEGTARCPDGGRAGQKIWRDAPPPAALDRRPSRCSRRRRDVGP